MRPKYFCVGLVTITLSIIVASASERAEQLMSIVAAGETNQLIGLVADLKTDKETMDYLVQKVTTWDTDRYSPRKARQALRVLVAAKAPEAIDGLLGVRTSWLIDESGPTTEPVPVQRQNHVKALIAIGDPSVQAILSDRYIGSEVIKEGRAYEYAVVIVGVKGAAGARATVTEALAKETRDLQKDNLTTLSKMIERAIMRIPDYPDEFHAPTK